MTQKFSTSDLYLAAFLEINSIPITFETVNGRVIAMAEYSPELTEVLNQYSCDLYVPVLTYAMKLRQLRARMHMHRETESHYKKDDSHDTAKARGEG